MRLAREPGGVVLEIADDGVGLDEAVTRRSGSAIIDALVEQIGGRLERRSKGGLHIALHFTTA